MPCDYGSGRKSLSSLTFPLPLHSLRQDLTDSIKGMLVSKVGAYEHPYVAILDFSLVVGMDSSAAHSIAKFKGLMHKIYQVEVSIFVTGTHREGFPCEYALAEALATAESEQQTSVDYNDVETKSPDPSRARRGSVSVLAKDKPLKAVQEVRNYPSNCVCTSLDEALVFAEDFLVARENPSLLSTPARPLASKPSPDEVDEERTEAEERKLACSMLESIVPMKVTEDVKLSVVAFVSKCAREEYRKGDIIWKEGDESDSVKILVSGTVCATLEGTNLCEYVTTGNIFGELGLVDGNRCLSTVTCSSRVAITYSLQKETFDQMVECNQPEARLLERIAIRYLAHRVQHVSNRIFETHCLPI